MDALMGQLKLGLDLLTVSQSRLGRALSTVCFAVLKTSIGRYVNWKIR